MVTLLISTKDFMLEFAFDEIFKLTKIKPKKKSSTELEIEFNEKKINEVFSSLYYYSRCIEHIVLENEDLVGFELSQRDWRIHDEKNSLPSLIAIYLYKKVIGNSKKFAMIDMVANFGELIIEYSSLGEPMHIQKRFKLPFCKKFSSISIPKSVKNENKFIGVVQNSREFRRVKENLAYTKVKPKISQYNLDWVDVKFDEKSVDYALSYLKFENQEQFESLQKEFIYQSSYIVKKKTGIICEHRLSEKILKKYKIKIEDTEEIVFEKKKYFVYVLKN